MIFTLLWLESSTLNLNPQTRKRTTTKNSKIYFSSINKLLTRSNSLAYRQMLPAICCLNVKYPSIYLITNKFIIFEIALKFGMPFRFRPDDFWLISFFSNTRAYRNAVALLVKMLTSLKYCHNTNLKRIFMYFLCASYYLLRRHFNY